MKVSIIVPVYNSENYIEKLIKSILNQNTNSYELILVDDGSTDNSYNILKEYSRKYNNIYAYKKTNTGPGFTRKYGFQKSSGDLLFFVDSDDWITNENVISEIIDCFSKNNIDVLFFNREDIIGDVKEIIPGFKSLKSGIYDLSQIREKIRPGLGAKILKRTILKQEMFIESNIFEDLYTTYLYLDQCKTFMYINKSYYTIYHDYISNSLSSKTDIKMFEKAIDIMLDIYSKLNSAFLKKSLAIIMADIFNSFCVKYLKRDKEYCEEYIIKKIKDIVIILNKEKIKINPQKMKILKNIFYSFMLKIWIIKFKYEY